MMREDHEPQKLKELKEELEEDLKAFRNGLRGLRVERETILGGLRDEREFILDGFRSELKRYRKELDGFGGERKLILKGYREAAIRFRDELNEFRDELRRLKGELKKLNEPKGEFIVKLVESIKEEHMKKLMKTL